LKSLPHLSFSLSVHFFRFGTVTPTRTRKFLALRVSHIGTEQRKPDLWVTRTPSMQMSDRSVAAASYRIDSSIEIFKNPKQRSHSASAFRLRPDSALKLPKCDVQISPECGATVSRHHSSWLKQSSESCGY